MKGFIFKGLTIICASMAIIATANANEKMMKNMKWMCETNASASENDMDKKADESMAKDAKPAAAAFAFAVKHCRDCTKITCTQDTKE